MYKTDKQRAAEGRPSYYTAPELDAASATPMAGSLPSPAFSSILA